MPLTYAFKHKHILDLIVMLHAVHQAIALGARRGFRLDAKENHHGQETKAQPHFSRNAGRRNDERGGLKGKEVAAAAGLQGDGV